MVADLNVHWTQARDGGEQPHAHVMLTMREVIPEKDGPEGREEAGFGKKVRDLERRGSLLRGVAGTLGGAWPTNGWLELGHDVRIDHRSSARPEYRP